MKKKLLVIPLMLLLLCIGASSYAFLGFGKATINGVVKDQSEKSIEGVQVKIKSSRFETLTDKQGNYTLEYTPGTFTVLYSKDGYFKHEITLALVSKDQFPAEDVILNVRFVVDPSKRRGRNSIGMEFVCLPPGTFMMGSPSNEPERASDERRHKVTISRPFYMQTTEVTQGQWKEIMGSNRSYFKNCGDDCPVEKVSWNDVQEFVRKLNAREQTNKYRLPTEAEWEYVCRAGTETPFSFGRCLSTDEANYNGNNPMPGCSKGKYLEKTVAVASFPANAWGLYDMHGNVWEWCHDWKGDYPSGHITDPKGPSSGSYRVTRGGTWHLNAWACRSALRGCYAPGDVGSDMGFRLARAQ